MKITILTTLFAFVTIVSSCAKDGESGSGAYPKNVGIEYRITSPTLKVLHDVTFSNETGGISREMDVQLPLSRTFNRAVKRYEVLTFNAGAIGTGTLKLEILINNKVEVTQSFPGTSVVTGTTSYIFK